MIAIEPKWFNTRAGSDLPFINISSKLLLYKAVNLGY